MSFESDYNKSQHRLPLEPDNPAMRKKVLNFLTKLGQEDLGDMLGLHHPIPSYDTRQLDTQPST